VCHSEAAGRRILAKKILCFAQDDAKWGAQDDI